MSRSVGNLVKNAIQSISDEQTGLVELIVTHDNESIYISVKDNGSGMTEEQSEKIFLPYFSTKISGMGLGLPLVKNMIENRGGKISFNTNLNVGTVFIITLPKNST